MHRMMEMLQDGGVGYMPEKKERGWIRIMFENWNSLGVMTQSWKVDRLNYLIDRLQIDVVAGCESQCDWSKVPPDKQFLNIVAPGRLCKGISAHNKTETISREQMGGMAIACIGNLGDVMTEYGEDTTGLSRWSWLALGTGTTKTIVISAYLPRQPGRRARGRTVWEQQARFFQSRGDLRYPSTIFIEHLYSQMTEWTAQGYHIILAIDANQDVYTGKLALTLRKEPLNITCLMEGAMGCQVPNSHFSGSKKISTIFGSAGVMTGNAMCFPHWYGVGDHRVMVLEVSAKASFGGKPPTISPHTARNLRCNITRIRLKYCKTLETLVQRHKIHQKLLDLELIDPLLTASEYQILHNKVDKELGDMMTCAERACTMYKGGSLEFSPTVGQWIKKRSVLKWILRWQDGKVPDTRNMLRAARRQNIENPLTMSRIEVEARLVACMWELFKLRDKAPAL